MKLVLSSLCIIFAFGLLSVARCGRPDEYSRNRHSLIFYLRYMCPSLPINTTRLMSADELATDATCQNNLASLSLDALVPEGLKAQDFNPEALNGSYFLNLLSENNFREEICAGFGHIKDCVDPYFQRREECIGRGFSAAQVRLLSGGVRMFCLDDFETILTEVLTTVGDDCIQAMFQSDNLGKFIDRACRKAIDGVDRAVKGGDKYEVALRSEYPIIIDKCFLGPVQEVCGAEASAQFQRLTDLYAQNAIL